MYLLTTFTSFFSIADIWLFPLCVLLLYAFLRSRVNKYHDKSLQKIFYGAFYFKVFSTLAYTFITETYFKGGDTGLYYQAILDMRDAMHTDLRYASTIINSVKLDATNPLVPFFYYDNYANDFTYNYMLSASNFSVPRLGLLPSVIFFDSYLCISMVFSFFALSGSIRLFKTFYHFYPNYKKEIAIATLFLPGVAFWSAGLLKDTVCYGAIGFIMYGVLNIFIRKKNYTSSVILVLGSSILLYYIKVYILLSLVLVIVIWMFAELNKLIRDTTLRAVFAMLTFTTAILMGYFILSYFTSQEFAKSYQIDTVLTRSEYQRKVFGQIADEQGGSSFDIGTSNPVLLVFQGIIATFFRPFPWDIRSPIMLFSGIEAFVFLYLTLYFMFKKGVGKFFALSMSDPRLIASFLFAMIFAVAVGSSTPNFGALSRYKIPCMPFYLLVLFIIYHKAGLPYPKFVQRIIKLIP